MNYDVYGIGNSLVDIQAQVTDEVLDGLGFQKGVMTLVDEETQRQVLGALDNRSVNRCAGGSAANTIIAVAQFGGKAAYAGKVGRDTLGEFFLDDMRRIGVSIAVPPANGLSGTCVVLITEDAQRTMLTHLGVSGSLSADDVDEQEIQKSQYVYVEGYLFCGDATKSAALKAIELAKKHGVRVALTVSDPSLVEHVRDEFWDLIRGPVDLLFCNLDEARNLTGKQDPNECAEDIHRHAVDVAVTLGEGGSILMHDGRMIPIDGVKTNAVDTTGAGDMYAAGLLYGITNGLTWEQAGRLASKASARVVSQLGARLAQPLEYELD